MSSANTVMSSAPGGVHGPFLDSNPAYEEHQIDFDASNGYTTELDVPVVAYGSVLSGAAGYTYGHPHNNRLDDGRHRDGGDGAEPKDISWQEGMPASTSVRCCPRPTRSRRWAVTGLVGVEVQPGPRPHLRDTRGEHNPFVRRRDAAARTSSGAPIRLHLAAENSTGAGEKRVSVMAVMQTIAERTDVVQRPDAASPRQPVTPAQPAHVVREACAECAVSDREARMAGVFREALVRQPPPHRCRRPCPRPI